MDALRIFRRDYRSENRIVLNAFEINHLKSLRIFNKSKLVEIYDGNGRSYSYHIPANAKDGDLVPNSSRIHPPVPSLVLAGGVPKGNRLDYLLQKATEIGVTEFHFISWERSIREDFSMDRCERIFAEACSQSERAFLPKVFQYENWRELLKTYSEDSLIALDPDSNQSLDTSELYGRVPLIGPEGGFGKELKEFQEANIRIRNLGSGVLRMETAFIYMASVMRQSLLQSKPASLGSFDEQ